MTLVLVESLPAGSHTVSAAYRKSAVENFCLGAETHNLAAVVLE